MAGTGKKWFVGCGVGCAVAALLSILLTVGGGILMTRPFNRAASTQRELTDIGGDREDYVPSPSGLTKDQLKRFYAVRLELAPFCVEFVEIAAKFRAMDEFEDSEDPPVGEMLKSVGGVMGAAMGMAGNIGKYTETRNRVLLAQDMSMGEYVWIYVLVYNSWLGMAPNLDFDDMEGGSYSRGERRIIRKLIENHIESLTESGRSEAAEIWQAEADRIMETTAGVPFEDGEFPPELAEMLEHRRGKFEKLYCSETSSFELSVIRKKGLSFHSD